MFTRYPHFRFLRPVALTSLLLGLCAVTAVVLLQQQVNTTVELRENLIHQRTAADLEESLIDLIGLLRNRVDDVKAIHVRIERHLENIRESKHDPNESTATERLLGSYQHYADLWRRIHRPGTDLEAGLAAGADLLESETLPRCRELVDNKTRNIERSEEAHRGSTRWLAWGMAGVGLTGAIAGLILGYGVARGLSRTIRRLQVHLQDAAGKLGPDLTEIVLTGEGDLGRLEGQIQELLGRIEQVVGKLQQREFEVLRAEQLAAVGQVAAGVAHEIRNPLTSIKMLVQMGREESAGLPLEDLEVIEREVNRMEQSLKVFLDFARLPKPVRSEQDLAVIAAQTLELIRGRALKQHVQLDLMRPPGPVRIEADGDQIRQVLVNLSLNALDAMPSGGKLQIVVRSLAHDAEAAVIDTGPGIAPELAPRLFEPFVSTKETGLGLGLVISRRIAEEHEGRLIASTGPTRGACFTLSLPRGK
jgi:two-component system, NtrC family, sensor histidine kinase HydH